MQLKNDSLMTSIFFDCVRLWDRFFHSQRAYDFYLRGTNLCQFCRQIFIYTPLILAAQVVGWGSVVMATIVVPCVLFGTGSYLIFIGVIVFVAFSIATFITLLVKWDPDPQEIVRLVRMVPQPHLPRRSKELAALWKQWMIARKRQICPLILFERREGRLNLYDHY